MNFERRKEARINHPVPADSPRLAKVPLRVLSQHACPFFPERQATMRGVYALKKYGRQYADLLDEGYWRRNDVIEKPVCRDCKACRAIRVPVDTFTRSRSQERCWRRNQDLTVDVADYVVDYEVRALLTHYLLGRHGWDHKTDDPEKLEQLVDWYAHRLGRSPVKSKAFKYRLDGALVGLSVVDDVKGALYSAFCAYDLALADRGLGNFSVLYEINWCRGQDRAYYYMANLIDGYQPAEYKTNFRPYQVRGDDGVWKVME